MKRLSLVVCLIVVLNIFSGCGTNNIDGNNPVNGNAESSKTSAVSSIASESTSEETATSSDTSKETSSSDNDSEASSVLESDINSSKHSSSSRFSHGGDNPEITYPTASEFIEFMKTPYEAHSDSDKKSYEALLKWKQNLTEFLFIKADKGYEISAAIFLPVLEESYGFFKGRAYSFHLRRKSSKKETYYLIDDKFNIGVYSVRLNIPKPFSWTIEQITGLEASEFTKKQNDKWGEYYISKDGYLLLFRYDSYVICILNKAHQSKKEFQKEWLNAFDLKYVSKPNELPKDTSSQAVSSGKSSIESTSSEIVSSETTSSQIVSSQDVSSQATSSEGVSSENP